MIGKQMLKRLAIVMRATKQLSNLIALDIMGRDRRDR